MSEPIQSIAQNNYILHNIDAKKLYVQEPLFTANSGDAVYVGWRPDETVLWSGSFTATAGSYFSISESVNNFEQIQFYFARDIANEAQEVQTYTPNAAGYNIFFIRGNPDNTDSLLYTCRLNYSDSNLRFTVNNQVVKVFGNTSHSQNTVSPLEITKVIGINRKENT